MASIKKEVNAGIHTATGIEFQKHCALYIFLESYNDINDKKYFICLEHHDDFIFCYQDDSNTITAIDTFQAKKSSGKWTINEAFTELTSKILAVGKDLDAAVNSTTYEQNLYFSTNNTIELKANKKNPVTKKNENYSVIVNEANEKVKFIEIEEPIKEKILDKLKKYNSSATYFDKITNLNLFYIDLPKTRKRQKELLIGQFGSIFGRRVPDHSAAVDTLIDLFRDVETLFNQGNVVKLLDKKKQVTSEIINSAIKVITTKTKAYELWRDEKNKISSILSISISDRLEFEYNFDSSLDLFKDKEQVEHHKVLNFVNDNINVLSSNYNDTSCINEFFNKFKATKTSVLGDNELKAAIFAAYVTIKE